MTFTAPLSAGVRVPLLLRLAAAALCLSCLARVTEAAPAAPLLVSETGSTRAVALDSLTFRREPFPLTTDARLSADRRTRVMLFAVFRLLPGEGVYGVTAEAEDGARRLYALPVEYVRAVRGQGWLHAVVVRLPDELGDVGDVLVRVRHHGVGSNRVRLAVGHVGGGPPDEVGAAPTPATAPATFAAPTPTPVPYGVPASEADAVRFLEQSSFGPTKETVARVSTVGIRAFLDEQFAAPASDYPDIVNDQPHLDQLQIRFYENALSGQDQLRQRVTFALQQLFVVSSVHEELRNASQINPYAQLLTRQALGNFRDIMRAVTLSPAMGRYQDVVNNLKFDPQTGVEPNENYARELMQLFTVGTFLLNQDGTPQLDARGRTVPTYTQETVEALARVFTGWTYAPRPGAPGLAQNPPYFEAPMVVGDEANHDSGPKTLLMGVTLPAGQTAREDLEGALDNIFNHPNVGPFIGRYLIQNLVTSNPSRAYVARVAAAFNDNGAGVRGDMKAVVAAVLLDSEARGDVKSDPAYGKLREPVQFYMNLIRSLAYDFGTNDLRFVKDDVGRMGQPVFYSPTVFNFYRPDYQLPGSSARAPEFEILNSRTAVTRANFASQLGVRLNRYAEYQALAADPPRLVEELNRRLLHGTMSEALRAEVLQAMSATAKKAQVAVFLVAGSPEFQIQR